MSVFSKLFDRKLLILDYEYCLPFLFLGFTSFGQDRCGTTVFNQPPSGQSLEENRNQFENWLKSKKIQKLSESRIAASSRATVYQIPVVVHIVHNGEDYGVGGNIPDEQIFSQITTLNEDFRRLNADQSDTPDDFLGVAADMEIEFVLAKRDSEGLPTDGIVRIQGNQEGFTINEAEILASNSYWPADQYMNIWVADLKHGSTDGLLGFAKFPLSDLEGLNENSTGEEPTLNELIDGVYIDYEYFGTGYNADSFSKGRTATHEIGHWLGLRHIWGDGNCSVDDFCNDTPTQSGSNSGCPSVDQESCGTVDMFQNYMDYTDDVCMNLFTTCQADRMRIVLESSPRRKELLESKGGIEPSLVANDLGIRSIESPKFGNCSLVVEPEIEVRNYGTNDITEFSIQLLVDEELIETLTITEALTPLQSFFVNFSSISIDEDVEIFTFKISEVNGVTDQNTDNDCQWISTYFPEHMTVPFVEDFIGTVDAGSDFWQRKNSNNDLTVWDFITAPQLTVENEAAVLGYFESSEEKFGELDYLISPVFDLSDLTTAEIKFKYAYAMHPDKYNDALTVVVSTDCGATFPESQVIFRKAGTELATTLSTTSSYLPAGPGDWIVFEWNISEYLGTEVVIAFIGSNGGGNNIYLDDIEVFSTAAFDYDIGIRSIENLSSVSCEEEVSMDIEVKNYGKQTINAFQLFYSFGGYSGTLLKDDLGLQPGKSELITLEIPNIEVGYYQATIQVDQPNGLQDENIDNNTDIRYFVIDNIADIIPVREKFSSELETSDWIFYRNDAPPNWVITTFGVGQERNHSATVNGFDILELGIENWLISPVLDFSDAEEASMTFDVSYANKIGRNDELKISVSLDCGNTYPFEVFSKKGGELAVIQSETAWLPGSDEDWREEFVGLNNFVGASEIRVAFVVTNQNGNNLYLDNIEFYESDEKPTEIEKTMKSYPNPASDYVDVIFNFNIKEEITIRLVSLNGEVMTEQVFPNTLNQVYRLNQIHSIPNGMYVLQVLGNYTKLSEKVLVRH